MAEGFGRSSVDFITRRRLHNIPETSYGSAPVQLLFDFYTKMYRNNRLTTA